MTDTLPPTLTPFEAGISVALMVICLGYCLFRWS